MRLLVLAFMVLPLVAVAQEDAVAIAKMRAMASAQTLMCVGVPDGQSLNNRCVSECVVRGVGNISYLQRRGEGGKFEEVYIAGGDYICPESKILTAETLEVLRGDALRVLGQACGADNMLKIEKFTLVPERNRAQVSATLICKRPLAP